MISDSGTSSIDDVFDRITKKLAVQRRVICAIAGPPGAGKSTVATALAERLDGATIVVPMDGFHYDNFVLAQLDLQQRKGSPASFDFLGYETAIMRLKRDNSPVALPLFDRSADLARAGAILVEDRHRLIITEGNYLLFDEAPWNRLAGVFDVSVFLAEDENELEKRLLKRWLDLGFPLDKAREKFEANDSLNVHAVLTKRVTTNVFTISNLAATGEAFQQSFRR